MLKPKIKDLQKWLWTLCFLHYLKVNYCLFYVLITFHSTQPKAPSANLRSLDSNQMWPSLIPSEWTKKVNEDNKKKNPKQLRASVFDSEGMSRWQGVKKKRWLFSTQEWEKTLEPTEWLMFVIVYSSVCFWFWLSYNKYIYMQLICISKHV